MPKLYKNILLHIVICCSFLMIPYVFVRNSLFRFPDFIHSPHDRFTVFVYCIMLMFLYVNFYFLIPKLYFQKRYAYYIGALLIFLIILLSVYYQIDSKERHPHEHMRRELSIPMHNHNGELGGFHPFKKHKPPTMPLMNQLLFLYLIGIFITLFIKVKRDLEKMLIEKNQAELAYLKSQINPHFLFNTFNSIYALAIREHADKTADGMLKLSGMMRYIVSETNTDFVPLEKEINYINDFIELQRLRLDKGIILNYVLNGQIEDQIISPLVLIPFIENAFKHGVNPDEASEIGIQLNIRDDQLFLQVKNNKVHHAQALNDQMGFGIANTRSRLERIYPGKFQLDIQETALHYEVNLNLTLV